MSSLVTLATIQVLLVEGSVVQFFFFFFFLAINMACLKSAILLYFSTCPLLMVPFSLCYWLFSPTSSVVLAVVLWFAVYFFIILPSNNRQFHIQYRNLTGVCFHFSLLIRSVFIVIYFASASYKIHSTVVLFWGFFLP